MSIASVTLTVYFEDPFWVGVFQRREGGQLSAAKVIFGAEPRDSQVYDLLLRRYYRLTFGGQVEEAAPETRPNPKWMQREARRQMQKTGVGTKSQQALSALREQNKRARRENRRERRRAEAERRFALKQEKRREKHKGR